MNRSFWPAVLSAILLGAGAVHAQPVDPAPETAPAGQVLRRFGLIGIWASDCSQPATPQNVHAIYAATYAGDASLSYDPGARYDPKVYDLSNARAAADGRLSYDEQRRGSGTLIHIVLVREGDRMQVWSSAGADGQSFIVNGKMTDGGADSPWLSKCPAA